MKKPFQDVQENQEFTYNGLQYTKIKSVKISCCRSINATAKDNANNRIYVQPNQEVEVND